MTRRVALAALALGLAVAAGAARAQPLSEFPFERPILTQGEGPHRLALDVRLLAGASQFRRLERIDDRDGAHWRAVNGLTDLRLFDSAGRQVPYLLIYPTSTQPNWIPGSVLPIPDTNTTSGFEIDLGASGLVDALHVQGIPAPFLKRLTLDGSGDRERWTSLVTEGTLFDLPEEALRHLTISFRPGTYRYLRVSWNDATSGRVELPRAVAARRVQSPPVGSPSPRIEAHFERRPSEPGRSRFRIRLPAGGLPIVGLVLETGAGHLFRPATVTESVLQGAQAGPREIGRATLARVVRQDLTAEDLRIPVSRPHDTQLELVVDDGSNPPLELTRVWLELAELPWIYFEAPSGPVVARYGARDVLAPRYDLEAARPGVRLDRVAEAAWGDEARRQGDAGGERAGPRPQPGPAIEMERFRVRRTLSGGSGLAVVPLDVAVLAHSRGVDAGFADIRIVDGSGRQIPYLLERLQEPLSAPLTIEPIELEARHREGHPSGNISAYGLRLPFRNLPSSSLVIETTAQLFARTVRVGFDREPDRAHRDAWFQELASAAWRHADGAAATSSLTLKVPSLDQRQLVLLVDEGDNSVLPIAAARLLLPAYRLRFYYPEGSASLIYGNPDIGPPRYDFELIAARVLGADAAEAHLGEEVVTPRPDPSGAGGLISRRVFWGALVVAVVVLAGLIVRLMRAREP